MSTREPRTPNPVEWPAMRAPASERLLLRDGTVALIRPSSPDDRALVQRFFHALSPDSRRQRFFASGDPAQSIVSELCDSSDASRQLTLLALRQGPGGLEPMAVASYCATDPATAEVSFAVADVAQGRGVGTALLERLAMIASSHGFEWFVAAAMAHNTDMLAVFRDSGFQMSAQSAHGQVDVRLRLQPNAQAVEVLDERNRAATVASLRPLLEPRAIAVIGVSHKPDNLGRRIFERLIEGGFTGDLHAVNPSAIEVAGRRSYASIADVPSGVDLAVVATPRAHVLEVIDGCAAAGIPAVVVISAGFAEVDAEGRALQQALVERTRAHGLRMIGPNCMGVVNARHAIRMNASFAPRLPPEGRLAIASQSGGVGLALLELAGTRKLGVCTFVSLGNKADVSGNDFLQWAESDPATSVLLLYLESFGNPRRFGQLARRIGRRKPIIVVKAGRTPAGTRAAGSHTAGLASSEAAVAALFAQAGVIRADTIDEMFDVAECLDLQPLPAGHRVGIISNTGGPGILAADACESAGLVINPFSDSVRQRLAAQLSPHASVGNPIDLVASAGTAEYEHAIVTTLTSSDVDSLLVMYTPIDLTRTTATLAGIGRGVVAARAAGAVDKPVVVCHFSVATQPAPLPAGNEQVPVYMFPENAARALGRASRYADWRRAPANAFWTFRDVRLREGRDLCRQAITARGETWLTGSELQRLLLSFGLPVVPTEGARHVEHAAAAAGRLGYPVALKVDSPRALHKTEVKGVVIDIRDERSLREVFADFAQRFPEIADPASGARVLVQPMIRGIETLVGVTDDPIFGPLVAFGLGGIETEILRDVAFRIAPLGDLDVDALLHAVKSFPLLEGYRGREPADVPALRDLLLRVSFLAQHVPELRELDLNPVIVGRSGEGCRIVDARARVARV